MRPKHDIEWTKTQIRPDSNIQIIKINGFSQIVYL